MSHLSVFYKSVSSRHSAEKRNDGLTPSGKKSKSGKIFYIWKDDSLCRTHEHMQSDTIKPGCSHYWESGGW